jgi:hypothetical protein
MPALPPPVLSPRRATRQIDVGGVLVGAKLCGAVRQRWNWGSDSCDE